MFFPNKVFVALIGSLFAISITTHPGHDVMAEMAERAAYMNHIESRSLSSCTDTLRERGIFERAGLRRRAMADKL